MTLANLSLALNAIQKRETICDLWRLFLPGDHKAVSKASSRISFGALIQKNTVRNLSPPTHKRHFPARFYSLRSSFRKKKRVWVDAVRHQGSRGRIQRASSVNVIDCCLTDSAWELCMKHRFMYRHKWVVRDTCELLLSLPSTLSIIIHQIHFSRQSWQNFLKRYVQVLVVGAH